MELYLEVPCSCYKWLTELATSYLVECSLPHLLKRYMVDNFKGRNESGNVVHSDHYVNDPVPWGNDNHL